MNTLRHAAAPLATLALCLAGCGGGGESGNAAGNGTLSIGVTDAPVDGATKVVVRFTAVEVKPQGGNAVTYDIPDKDIDLLSLAGGKSAGILDNQSVPAGAYEWIRLLIESQQNTMSSYVELKSGAQYSLYVPSGEESGLKLIRGFNVAVGGKSDFTVDFDLRKSVIAPPGQSPNYMLKPVLRIVDNLQVGTISGTVPVRLIPTGCTPFIYVFSGSSVVPDDLDPAPAPDVDPLISVPVTLDNATGNYSFKVPFLEAGNYTVAFTCDGARDTPEGEETLAFSPTLNVTVNANQTVTASIP